MNKKVILIVAAICLIAADSFAYSPVIIVGAETYLGLGSSNTSMPISASNLHVDLDMRGTLGETIYVASWASVEAWLSGGVVTDQSDVGFTIGHSGNTTQLQANGSLSASSSVGDDTVSLAPDWKLGLETTLSRSLVLELVYAGGLDWDDSKLFDNIRHEGLLTTRFDPSLELGVIGGIRVSTTGFSEQFELDGAGLPTTSTRRDNLYAGQLGVEGLVGYFGQWSLTADSGILRSNANRYLAVPDIVDQASENRTFLDLTLLLSGRPLRQVGLEGGMSVAADWYSTRAALDEGSLPIGEPVRVWTVRPHAHIDWTPNGWMYLAGDIQGAYSVSNDIAEEGLSVSGLVSVEFRL